MNSHQFVSSDSLFIHVIYSSFSIAFHAPEISRLVRRQAVFRVKLWVRDAFRAESIPAALLASRPKQLPIVSAVNIIENVRWKNKRVKRTIANGIDKRSLVIVRPFRVPVPVEQLPVLDGVFREVWIGAAETE
jgi:hypothetical protein